MSGGQEYIADFFIMGSASSLLSEALNIFKMLVQNTYMSYRKTLQTLSNSTAQNSANSPSIYHFKSIFPVGLIYLENALIRQ